MIRFTPASEIRPGSVIIPPGSPEDRLTVQYITKSVVGGVLESDEIVCYHLYCIDQETGEDTIVRLDMGVRIYK